MTVKTKLPVHLRLPEDVIWGDDRGKIIKRFSNIGLLYNKYPLIWTKKDKLNEAFQNEYEYEYINDKGKTKREKINLKNQFLKEILDNINTLESSECLKNISQRQTVTIANLKSSGLQVLSFEATTDSRLIIGLGGTSVIETGMTLHPLYGFPYLPGSGIKGLARAYAEIAVEPKPSGDELLEVFGSDHKDPQKAALDNRQGKVFFMDALPTQFPKLELDIMNSHYGEYYRGEKPPADYLNPVSVTFLAIAAGQKFSFALYSRYEKLLAKAKKWLIGGLSELGAGGKTNVGYGYFKMLEQQAVEPAREQEQSAKSVVLKEDYLLAKLKSVKNAETFAAFIKQLDTKDPDALNTISFKGMESVINIGLVSTLETSEVSQEIKQIIAQKMLEICKEPDKKYAEKLKKYQQLQTIAGVDKP